MKIKVTLDGGAGELDSKTFEVAEDHEDQDEAINLGAADIIEEWTLSVGDTITIREIA